jgi:hypothetical protein
MTEEKLIQLVEKIESQTRAGNLNWEGTATDNEFQATLGNFVLRVARHVSSDGSADFIINFVDKGGSDLESLSDIQLAKIARKAGGYGVNAYDLMESIFKNAKRTALGVEKALDDILSELDDLPPPE